MTGLHILMTADAVGGVWQYATDLARELSSLGHTVTIAVLGPPPDEAQRASARSINGVRLIDTCQPLDWMCSEPAPVELAAHEIARLARECGADLIHCNSPAMIGSVDFPVPVLAVAHGCIATWWQAAKPQPLDADYRWHREMTRRGLVAADAVMAPSASFAAMIQATYRLPQMPCVVHNGRPSFGGNRRVQHRLDAALTIGRMWDPVKNGLLLDRAAALIDLPFLAAGALRAPHGEEVSFSHIEALGQLPEKELRDLLTRQPIFVSAATFEPFGLAVLEAASASCALVLSDILTFRELWDGAALFVDPGDAHGFAAAIDRLHAEPGFRKGLGETAKLRSERYSPAAMGRSVASIYQMLKAAREAAA